MEARLQEIQDTLEALAKKVDIDKPYSLTEIGILVYHHAKLDNPLVYKGTIRWRESTYRLFNYQQCFYKATSIKYQDELMPIKRYKFLSRENWGVTLREWIHNRKVIIEKHANYKELNGVYRNRLRYESFFTEGRWSWCLDYFFTHIEEFITFKAKLHKEYKEAIRAIETMPSKDEDLYILSLITRNKKAITMLNSWLKNKAMLSVDKVKIRTLIYRNDEYIKSNRVVNLISLNQIEGLLWLRDNYKLLFPSSNIKIDSDVDMAMDRFRELLANPNEFIKKYDCKYIEGKIYKSMYF